MQVAQTTIEHEIGRIAQEVLGDEYRVFLFGSRAQGTATSRSDYDIGIEGEVAVPLERLSKFKEELAALPTLAKIDVVDFSRATEDFTRIAKHTTRPLKTEV